jgi:hypothetical protein
VRPPRLAERSLNSTAITILMDGFIDPSKSNRGVAGRKSYSAMQICNHMKRMTVSLFGTAPLAMQNCGQHGIEPGRPTPPAKSHLKLVAPTEVNRTGRGPDGIARAIISRRTRIYDLYGGLPVSLDEAPAIGRRSPPGRPAKCSSK